ncbi:MAG: type II toxin-antitoxin system VapC family toxin [Bacteroidota bacterium]
MGAKYLIDSNVLIEYIGLLLPPIPHSKLSSIIDDEYNISFINKIEVLGHSSSNEEIAAFINAANIYNINLKIIDETIRLRKHLKIKLPDAIIAATAITNNLILITRNINDFKSIDNLIVQNPYSWNIEE